MRILLYSQNYAPELTGVGKYSSEMAIWLSEKGHEVRVVTSYPYYPQWRVFEEYSSFRYSSEILNNVYISRCPIYVPKRQSGFRRILCALSFAVSSFPVILSNLFWKPDLVWVVEPSICSLPSAIFLSKISNALSWLHVQDFEIDASFELGIFKAGWMRRLLLKVEIFLMRRFDRVSAISNAMVEKLYQKGLEHDKAKIFINWVDTSAIFPIPKSIPNKFRLSWGVCEDDVVLMYSGNMGEKQGLDLLIDVARRVVGNKKIYFVMCGEGATYLKLRRISSDLQNIIWMPLQPTSDLNELLNAADIHLLPQISSVSDLVMPSKLTGIFASGRPVIATANQSTMLHEVIEGRGLSVPYGDVEAFVNAIFCFLDNPEKLEKFGNASRKYALDNLDVNVVLSNFESDLKLALE